MASKHRDLWRKILVTGAACAGLLLLWSTREPKTTPPTPVTTSDEQQPKVQIVQQRESLTLLASYKQAALPEEKQKLLHALAKTQDLTITGKLIELLAVETNEDAADTMQWMLVRMADATVIHQIAERYESVPGADEGKRLATVVQRIRLDDLAGLLATFIDAPIPMEDMLAKASLIALREIGSPFAADALARRLDTAATEADRAYLELALAGIRRPGTQHSLIAIATGRQEATQTITRLAAIQALSNYHDPESREALAALAQSQVPELSAAAHQVINRQR
jgi:hypothetical protein